MSEERSAALIEQAFIWQVLHINPGWRIGKPEKNFSTP
jgi:hypothetical protein